MARLALFVAISLFAATVVAVFPAECETAATAVSNYDNGYLCPKLVNGCHHTATRLVPMFANADAVAVKHASFASLYTSICGATQCKPQKDAIYQISIVNGANSHSLFMACRKGIVPAEGSLEVADPRGCVVMQAWAGSFALFEWISKADVATNKLERSGSTIKGNRIPIAHERYGRFQELHGEKLHTYLTLLNGLVTVDGSNKATGTVRSLTTVWLCQVNPMCSNLLAAEDGTALLPEDNAKWDAKLPDPTVGAKIIAHEFPWDGTCKVFDDVRKHGATFPSPFCVDQNKMGMCTYGLGKLAEWVEASGQEAIAEHPAKAGYLPPGADDSEKWECKPRA